MGQVTGIKVGSQQANPNPGIQRGIIGSQGMPAQPVMSKNVRTKPANMMFTNFSGQQQFLMQAQQ